MERRTKSKHSIWQFHKITNLENLFVTSVFLMATSLLPVFEGHEI